METSTEKLVAFPFHAWSVVIAFASDWLLFAVNLATDLHLMPTAVVVFALVAGIATAGIEFGLSRSAWSTAGVKGLLIAVLVAAPLPMLGTVLGLVGLTWAVTLAVSRERRSKSGAKQPGGQTHG